MRTPSSSLSSPSLTTHDHLEAWTRSGLSARAYAERHDINPSTLYKQRARHRALANREPTTQRLVPVVVDACALCEVTLPDGRRLRFPESLSPATLRAFLVAMERP